MRDLWKYTVLAITLCYLAATGCFAQKQEVEYKMSDGLIEVHITGGKAAGTLDSILMTFGTTFEGLETIWDQKMLDSLIEGWKLVSFSPNEIVMEKGIKELSGGIDWLTDLVLIDGSDIRDKDFRTLYPRATYGRNSFRRQSIVERQDGYTYFYLDDHDGASSVFLSGSFNQWSTLGTRMERRNGRWAAKMKLSPGKYLYKFIVDGEWIPDPDNKLREPDGHQGFNSVYFVYNHEFQLDGYADVKRVYVAGSFNGWKSRDLRMFRSGDKWSLPAYIREGTHAYKFIVDGEWILDPDNQTVRTDGRGNLNSFFSIGDTLTFRLEGHTMAKKVVVTGTFNAWNEQELEMQRTAFGWELPYVLAPGNYEYKYIVDGTWMPDPANPMKTGEGDYVNSVLFVDPNVRLRLEDRRDANTVSLTGSFNGWSETGWPLQRENGSWVIDIHLPPGKHLYKYIVDGEWITDPSNPHWEQNEFGTGNSVLWVKPSGSL